MTLIITRTPFRISFLGGGSDYPQWYREHMGMCVGATIDKYCYITYQPNQEQFRVLYSQLEEVSSVEGISHPAIRACLEYVGMTAPAAINHMSDLHSRSGIGSSSAFVVGLLNALYSYSCITPDDLAWDAIKIEQDILREPVGSQDQVLTASGGVNQVIFHPAQERPAVRNLGLETSTERIRQFQDHLMLFYTGPRPKSIPVPLKFPVELTQRLATMAKEGSSLIVNGDDLIHFGELLDEGWHLKKQMSKSISTLWIDAVYSAAKEAGAVGGKLLGAGGGGFMLIYARPDEHRNIQHALRDLTHVPFQFDYEGTKVIYNG